MEILQTGNGRAFINSGNGYRYHNFMKVEAVDKPLGDVTPIYYIDDNNNSIDVAKIRSGSGRPTTSLSGYYQHTPNNSLEKLANGKKSFDIQIHYGNCRNPTDFNTFDAAIVLKNCDITGYGLSELTTLTPDGREIVTETAQVSFESLYRILPITEIPTMGKYIGNDAPVFGVATMKRREKTVDTLIVGMITSYGQITFAYSSDTGITWDKVDLDIQNIHDGLPEHVNMILSDDYLYVSIIDNNDLYIYRVSTSSVINGTPTPHVIMGPLNS